MATEAGHEDLVTHGWLNLGSGAGEVRDYETAEPALREAAGCAAERDLDVHAHYVTAWLARVRLEQGGWSAAADLVPACRSTTPPSRRSRRSWRSACAAGCRPAAATPTRAPDLDRAWALARETADLQRLWPIAAARAEAGWLAGAPAAIPGLVDDVYALACEVGHAWGMGELGF